MNVSEDHTVSIIRTDVRNVPTNHPGEIWGSHGNEDDSVVVLGLWHLVLTDR